MFDLWKLRSGLFYEADDKAGGGTTGTDPGSNPDAEKAKDESSKAGDDAKGKKLAAEFKWTPEQQAEINRINKETRLEERKKAQTEFDEKVAKAQKEAEDKQLTEKQEWQKLAEKRGTEIETLKAEVTTLTEAQKQGEKYKTALEAHLKTQIERLPDHIKTLLSKLDVLEQMKFLTENAGKLGVKLDSVDPTPPENQDLEKAHEAKQGKEMRSFVKSIT